MLLVPGNAIATLQPVLDPRGGARRRWIRPKLTDLDAPIQRWSQGLDKAIAGTRSIEDCIALTMILSSSPHSWQLRKAWEDNLDTSGVMQLSHMKNSSSLESGTRSSPSSCCGDFVFVHAGLRPLVPIGRQTEDDPLWIRDEFLLWDRPFEKVVVHGHTPVHKPDIRSNRVNIDTGAFATGCLTSMVFELVDVRIWARGLAEWDAQCIGSARYRSADAASGVHRSLAALAAAHVRERKNGSVIRDGDLLGFLNPRPAI